MRAWGRRFATAVDPYRDNAPDEDGDVVCAGCGRVFGDLDATIEVSEHLDRDEDGGQVRGSRASVALLLPVLDERPHHLDNCRSAFSGSASVASPRKQVLGHEPPVSTAVPL